MSKTNNVGALGQLFAEEIPPRKLMQAAAEQYKKWILSGRTDSLAHAKFAACVTASANLSDF